MANMLVRFWWSLEHQSPCLTRAQLDGNILRRVEGSHWKRGLNQSLLPHPKVVISSSWASYSELPRPLALSTASSPSALTPEL
jgi:hypothetical protein